MGALTSAEEKAPICDNCYALRDNPKDKKCINCEKFKEWISLEAIKRAADPIYTEECVECDGKGEVKCCPGCGLLHENWCQDCERYCVTEECPECKGTGAGRPEYEWQNELNEKWKAIQEENGKYNVIDACGAVRPLESISHSQDNRNENGIAHNDTPEIPVPDTIHDLATMSKDHARKDAEGNISMENVVAVTTKETVSIPDTISEETTVPPESSASSKDSEETAPVAGWGQTWNAVTEYLTPKNVGLAAVAGYAAWNFWKGWRNNRRLSETPDYPTAEEILRRRRQMRRPRTHVVVLENIKS